MELLHFVQQWRVVVALLVSLAVASLAVFYVYRLNLGPDYADAWVLQLTLDHEESASNIYQLMKDNYAEPSRVEREDKHIFKIYFQNLSSENEERLLSEAETLTTGVSDVQHFLHQPQAFFFIRERILKAIGIFLATWLLYQILSLKKLDLSYLQVTAYVFTDLVLWAWEILVIVGMVSILGSVGVVMDHWFAATAALAILLCLVLKVFDMYRLIDKRRLVKSTSISHSLKEVLDQDWPTSVFLITIIGVVVVLPFTVLNAPLFAGTALLLLAILISLFSNLAAKLHVLGVIEEFLSRNVRVKNFLAKRW